MENNKLFESAGMLLIETAEDQIYGDRVTADALEDDAFIEADKQLSNDIDVKVSELLEKLNDYKKEFCDFWDNNQEAIINYGKHNGADDLYKLYAGAYGSLDYDSTENFYDEYT